MRFVRALVSCTRKLSSSRLLAHESLGDKSSGQNIVCREDQVPKQSDVIIVGGGLMGWSVAFWLRWMSKFSVTLIERDPTYSCSASVLGIGSLRQQFSEPENIQMSLFTSDFIRNIRDYLTTSDEKNIDIGFNPQGCLLLADADQALSLKQNFELQVDLGARVQLFSKTDLSKRWPWLNLDDIELGCYGYENEGWFDPWLLLRALRSKCHTLGVNYVVGEVFDFESSPYVANISFLDKPQRAPVSVRPLREVLIARPDGSTASITFNMVINAAGPWTQDIAKLAEIGSENIPFAVPIELRTRNIFVVKPNPNTNRYFDPRQQDDDLKTPGLDSPFLIDPNRLFVERNGLTGEFIVYSDHPDLEKHNQVPTDNDFRSDADINFFKQFIAPWLTKRIPSMKDAQVTSSWIAPCDYNTIDQNVIVGHHPYHVNMYLCSGSSGHGNQHALAIGRAIAELILYGHYKTIDLTRFSFDRFYLNHPICEANAF